MFNTAVFFRRNLFALLLVFSAAAVGCGGAADKDDASFDSKNSGGILEEGSSPSTDGSDDAGDDPYSVGDPSDEESPVLVGDINDDEQPSADLEADTKSDTDTDTKSDTDQSGDQTGDQTDGGGQTADAPPASNGSNPLAFLNRSDMRAMWVWSEIPGAKEIVENIGGAQDELLQFAAAPHGDSSRALNRLYFEARGHTNADRWSQPRAVTYDPLLDTSKQGALRSFLRRAHSQGIDVEYLDGQAIWVASDALAEVPKQICRDIVAFNKTTNDVAERLDGAHFDIEPHTVREGPYAGLWWENRLDGGYNAEWTQRWKGIMNSCRAIFDAYEAETGHKLILASDVGADYAYYNKPILEFFNGPNSPVDYIGIMNYYDNRPNANGQPSFFFGESEGGTVTGGVEQNLELWTNTPLVFGLETGPTSIAPDWMSFYQEGYNAMNTVVDQLRSDYGTTQALGVAIHHYSPNSYKDLNP
ncbi:hypothetical protein FIV42_17960 [Persicimonas caeni]|uniref:Uncharacterized protein n=1 Tax=Persicimonas caeni TaxID=2292766 RepID=A0A4Y6PW28_PERCE|nr:hypothetical protein [Persicimonas caeni]QDG52551.1 hypothetical protein FIV42_17960 [Persicimonas caeni]QED33773.1 hypothetical protein FRD00_17955 [Persicimonas caeni]